MQISSRPVDVISVCSRDGVLSPLRFQLQDEDQQLLRIRIDRVISCREIQHVGAEAQVFLCRAVLWGRMCTFELKYSIRKHTWHLLGNVQEISDSTGKSGKYPL